MDIAANRVILHVIRALAIACIALGGWDSQAEGPRLRSSPAFDG
jgi:hypothetical protein